jgi:hypothetical protein
LRYLHNVSVMPGEPAPSPALEESLAALLRDAELPAAESVRRLSGRGFDNEVHVVRLADGRQVVLRRGRRARDPEIARAAFLQAHGVPAPRLLAAHRHASLYEFAPGELLGDLIESGRATDRMWELVGLAYRRVHDVSFPSRLEGEFGPRRLILRPVDPVEQLHTRLKECAPGLRRRCRGALVYLPALHELVDSAAGPLQSATTALLLADDNMWNVIADAEGDRAWLIDWDGPQVGDPAMEVALLDKHASLFNGGGLPAAFFVGYGQPATEPNTSLHRVIQTVRWAASRDWGELEEQDLPPEQKERARGWLRTLLAYVAQLPDHIERLRSIV